MKKILTVAAAAVALQFSASLPAFADDNREIVTTVAGLTPIPKTMAA